MRVVVQTLMLSAVVLAGAMACPVTAVAHCDGLDGPVVSAARHALETGNVAHVLVWVQRQDEGEVRAAFEKTLAVRRTGPEAKELADRFFFETVVRVHRAGEGAPYTGLKPAGRDLGPAIPAADQALQKGSVDALVKLLTEAVEHGVRERFAEANRRKSYDETNVSAGREYVKAYVSYLHYVERLYEATKSEAHGHYAEQEPPAAHAE